MRGTRNGGGRSVSSPQARVTPTVRTMEIRPIRHIGPDPLPAFIRLTPTCVMCPVATRLAETGTSETTGREAGTTGSGDGRWKTCADHLSADTDKRPHHNGAEACPTHGATRTPGSRR